MRGGQLSSKMDTLAADASRARDRLHPGSDEQLRQLDRRLADAQKNRETLSAMVANLSSRKPTRMLGATS